MNAPHVSYAKLASIITLAPSFLNAHCVGAFQPPSSLLVSRSTSRPGCNIALREKINESTTAPANVGSTSTDWIREEFESPSRTQLATPQPSEAKNRRFTSSEGLLNKGRVVGPDRVLVYDTTLRDGTQMESISVSCNDKLKITQRLSKFNMDYIEAGWPGSNPKDEQFFSQAKLPMEEGGLDEITKSKLVAFGSTRRKGIKACDDGQIQKLIESGAPTICIVAKAHLWQVTDIIRADPDENLQMIFDSVSHLTQQGREVMVDLEHYFDGFKFDKEYTLKCCKAAMEGGAKVLVMCDTNGGTMPWEVDQITRETIATCDVFESDIFGAGEKRVTFGMHAHNDCGLAVANSLTAAKAGVGLIQGTVNGIGERTGNADLCSIVPSLALHVDTKMNVNENLEEITGLSRFLDETLNRTPNKGAPYVGHSAFAHKGGLHVAALERSPDSYQHIDPSRVGNQLRVLISELSGRQNILGKIKKLDLGIADDVVAERALVILDRVKRLESMGYTFEGADASVELMILHSTQGYCPPFRVLDYTAQVYDTNVDSASRVMSKMENGQQAGAHVAPNMARATIKVRVLDDPKRSEDEFLDRLEVSEGKGPVDALANALKKALAPSHPSLDNLQLIDYKVRILDPESATQAATRVMIEFSDPLTNQKWSTVSVDRNIISASLNALVDGFEYALKDVVASCVIDDFDEKFE
eukprot:CCRYP_003984-RA/>CCRYP_003984-RA protein AED:0.03 eAED:0.03 QI:216/1/1/1/1/1/4/279/698